MNDSQKCCDKCKYYEWYYDKCTKWDCLCDARECHSCFEDKVDKEEVEDESRRSNK